MISRLYQSDDAALQALRQNSQILLPVYSSPTLLQDSYDGLLAAMGPASRVDMRLQPRTPCEVQASRHRSAGSSNTALHTVHAAAGHSTQHCSPTLSSGSRPRGRVTCADTDTPLQP